MTSPALPSVVLIASNFVLLLLNCRLWSGEKISLNSCWQSDNLLSLNSLGELATSLLLSSNERICSFNWIRGSKHCFLTNFSNFCHYFLFLAFLQHRYLLVSLHPSWLRGTPISHPVLIPFVLQMPRRTCAPKFLAHIMYFLEVRCLWEPGTRISTGILSPFHLSFQRFLVRMSIGRSQIIPFLLV